MWEPSTDSVVQSCGHFRRRASCPSSPSGPVRAERSGAAAHRGGATGRRRRQDLPSRRSRVSFEALGAVVAGH